MRNNKKYFIISDVHSFYKEMITALNIAGYNKKNKNHILIVLGDIFDRGPDSLKIYKFLRSIPKSRLKLVKGNHEHLFLTLVDKTLPSIYDFNNGTVDAFIQLTNTPIHIRDELYKHVYFYPYMTPNKLEEDYYNLLWKNIVLKLKQTDIIKWLESDEWLEYYELDNLIFVHSFIPLRKRKGIYKSYKSSRLEHLTYFPNWRTDTNEQEWFSAKWDSPWNLYKLGFFKEEEKNGQTLVCGHWHTSDFHEYLGGERNSKRTDIYFSKGIIGIDGGVKRKNNKLEYDCNVLIYENKKFYDKYGKEFILKEN